MEEIENFRELLKSCKRGLIQELETMPSLKFAFPETEAYLAELSKILDLIQSTLVDTFEKRPLGFLERLFLRGNARIVRRKLNAIKAVGEMGFYIENLDYFRAKDIGVFKLLFLKNILQRISKEEQG